MMLVIQGQVMPHHLLIRLIIMGMTALSLEDVSLLMS